MVLSQMMEEDQEQGFLCRFCNKSFLDGMSLGVHMRGHLGLISSEKSNENFNEGLISSEMDPENGVEFGANYGLRENPKKSWRISKSKHGAMEKSPEVRRESWRVSKSKHGSSKKSAEVCKETACCKECGKQFDSMKAVFGHMRSHSKKTRVSSELEYKVVSACLVRKKRSPTSYSKMTSNPSSNFDGSSFSTVSEIEEDNKVAMCLLMLSSGIGNWDEFNLINKFSNNNSTGNLDAQSLIQSKGNSGMEIVGICGEIENFDEKKVGFEASVDESLSCDKFKKINEIKKGISPFGLESMEEIGVDQGDLGLEKINSIKKSKFANQDFEFGGNSCEDHLQYNNNGDSEFLKVYERKHKTTHKSENSTQTSILSDLKVEPESGNIEIGGVEIASFDLKKIKEHECSICFKVFRSGQALGGHKKAHYVGQKESKGKETMLMDQELPDHIDNLLELNLPLNMEEESKIDVGKPWWAGNERNYGLLSIFN